MAQIDIHFATVYIEDGYAGPGGAPKVNNVAGYPSGTSTMLVTGFTGVIATGDQVKVGVDPTVYTITAHVETTGNTTSITFTPPTVPTTIANNTAITVLPHRLEIKIGEGTVGFDEKRKIVYTLNRGIIDSVRQGDQEPMDVKFDIIWEHLKASTGDPPTIEDALKKRGAASSWVSAAADPCEVYAVNITIENIPPCTSEDYETIVLPYFRWESINHDLKNATLAVTGKCNALEALVTRIPAA